MNETNETAAFELEKLKTPSIVKTRDLVSFSSSSSSPLYTQANCPRNTRNVNSLLCAEKETGLGSIGNNLAPSGLSRAFAV